MERFSDLIDGGVDNIDILCSDVPKVFSFYRDVLGLKVLQDWDVDLEMAAVSTGNVDIFLLQTSAKHEGRRTGENETDMAGLSGFAIRVVDAKRAIAALDPHVEWAGPLHEWEHPDGSGFGYHYRHFYDPEGNQVLLTEPHGKPAPRRP